jgi:hypothetical protein
VWTRAATQTWRDGEREVGKRKKTGGSEVKLGTHVGGGGKDGGRAEAGGRKGPEEVTGVGHLVCVQGKEKLESRNWSARESGRAAGRTCVADLGRGGI